MLLRVMTRQMEPLVFVYITSCFLSFVDGLSSSQQGCNYFLSPTDLRATYAINTIRIPIKRQSLYYLPYQHCEWIIRAENPNDVINVYIKTCQIEGQDLQGDCMRDYLDFYEETDSGKQMFMGRYCGNKCQGRLLETSYSNMMIHFISDGHYQFRGFELTYMAQPKKHDDSSDKTNTALAVAIPVGLISLTVAVIVIIWFYRHWFSSKNSNSNPPSSCTPQSSTPCQNNRTPPQQRQQPRLHPQLIASLDTAETEHRRISSYNDSFSQEGYHSTPEVVLPAYSAYDTAPLQVDLFSENLGSNSRRSAWVQRRQSRPFSAAAVVSMATDTPLNSTSTANELSTDNGGGGGGRSLTPPPSYEFTIMHDRMLRQEEGGEPILPDYDSVVKSSDVSYSNSESRV